MVLGAGPLGVVGFGRAVRIKFNSLDLTDVKWIKLNCIYIKPTKNTSWACTLVITFILNHSKISLENHPNAVHFL